MLQGFFQRLDLLELFLQFLCACGLHLEIDACPEGPLHLLDQGLGALVDVSERIQVLESALQRFHAVFAVQQGGGLEGDEDVRVCGDATLLGILLRNLVDNAIRYTPAGGSVVVRAERRRDGAALVVSDTGPGIPAAQRARVRERFYRVLGSGEEGSGLGLSIVQRIADLHGARLTLGDGPGGSGLSAEVAFFAVQP